MSWNIIYFDNQIRNIECLRKQLAPKFTIFSGVQASGYVKLLQTCRPHLILIDTHMPIVEEHTLYELIIKNELYNGCPIVFIGDPSEENNFRSQDYGGIDFLSRELLPEELEVRLISKIKFYQQTATKLELGNLMIDLNGLTIKIQGEYIDVTLLEMRLINALARRFPEIMTRTELIKKVWGEDCVKSGTVNTHITNLRSKIEAWDHIIKFREDNVLILPKA